jgi:hypothetical protein
LWHGIFLDRVMAGRFPQSFALPIKTIIPIVALPCAMVER